MIFFYSYGAAFKLLVPFKPFKATTAGGMDMTLSTAAGGMNMAHSTAEELTTASIDDDAADAFNEMGDMVDMDHSARLMKYKILSVNPSQNRLFLM